MQKSSHGHHRVIVLGLNCRYHGSYNVEDEPTRVEGADVFFDNAKDPGKINHFTRSRIPRHLVIDGALVDLCM